MPRGLRGACRQTCDRPPTDLTAVQCRRLFPQTYIILTKETFMSRYTRVLAIAAITTAMASSQALAHAHLKSSVPADKATAAAPTELDLTFTEGVNLKFSGIKVTGPDGQEVKLGDAMLMDGDKTLMVPVSGKLQPGAYSVEWHVLSADGHKVNGSYTFTVKP